MSKVYNIDFETDCGIILEIDFLKVNGDVDIDYVEGLTPCGTRIDDVELIDRLMDEYEHEIYVDCASEFKGGM